jgi:hypothetical protein
MSHFRLTPRGTPAPKCGKRIYASDPLVVKHAPGWSNTWGKRADDSWQGFQQAIHNISLYQNLHGEQHPAVAIIFQPQALVQGKQTREMQLQFTIAGLVPGFKYEVVVQEVHVVDVEYIQHKQLVLSVPHTLTFTDNYHVTIDLAILEHQDKYRLEVTVLDMCLGLTTLESFLALKRVMLPLTRQKE